MKKLNALSLSSEMFDAIKANIAQVLETEFDTKISAGKADYVAARVMGFENHHALKSHLDDKSSRWWELMIQASGNFLTERLPAESIDWDDEELEEYAVENAWAPFEYWVGGDLIEVIEGTAQGLMEDFRNV